MAEMAAGPSPRAAIVGLAGPTLTTEERALFRARRPAGLILFARNVEDPTQLRALTQAARDLLGADLPILVDQEGGRVARLRPPHWPAFPAAAAFEGLPAEAARANAALLGLTCHAMGIDVVCAPVLDLRLPGGHAVIGDRAFAADPAEVVRLGRAWVEGLHSAGCVPVLKHIPGHGRALVDSHLELPHIPAGRDALAEDCAPFAALAGSGAWAMTGHLLLEALDPRHPVTLSHDIIGRVIRRAIGFQGVLVSDDLAMQALRGAPGALAQHAIAAGCDLALHCTGVLAETAEVLADCPALSEAAAARLAESRAVAAAARQPALDPAMLAGLRDSHLAAAA
jgi:beta-N-acetylhexosaminidase